MPLVAAVLWVAGCAPAPSSSSETAGVTPTPRAPVAVRPAPEATVATYQLAERAGGATLAVARARRGDADDGWPAGRYRWSGAGGDVDLGPALVAHLVPGGVVLVDDRGTLTLRRPGAAPRVIDEAVRPDLALDATGTRWAWAAGTEDAVELRVTELDARLDTGRDHRPARRVAGPLAHLDRIAFAGEAIVFVGAETGGLPGLYVVVPDGGAARRLTNRGMRAGQGLPAAFVPPPVRAASVVAAGGGVRYCDGEAGWWVDLASGLGRADAEGCAGGAL